jgi:hypothetical protein
MQTEFNKKDTSYVFNHISLKLIYHKPDHDQLAVSVPEEAVRLVSARATPLRSAVCLYLALVKAVSW